MDLVSTILIYYALNTAHKSQGTFQFMIRNPSSESCKSNLEAGSREVDRLRVPIGIKYVSLRYGAVLHCSEGPPQHQDH